MFTIWSQIICMIYRDNFLNCGNWGQDLKDLFPPNFLLMAMELFHQLLLHLMEILWLPSHIAKSSHFLPAFFSHNPSAFIFLFCVKCTIVLSLMLPLEPFLSLMETLGVFFDASARVGSYLYVMLEFRIPPTTCRILVQQMTIVNCNEASFPLAWPCMKPRKICGINWHCLQKRRGSWCLLSNLTQ